MPHLHIHLKYNTRAMNSKENDIITMSVIGVNCKFVNNIYMYLV